MKTITIKFYPGTEEEQVIETRLLAEDNGLAIHDTYMEHGWQAKSDVRKMSTRCYSICHKATSLSIARYFRRLKDAKEALAQLAKLADWPAITKENVKPELGQAVRAITRSYEGVL